MAESDNLNGHPPEDEVLKEVEEIDWTEEDPNMAAPEETIEDFDVGELECVDEEGEEKKCEERRSNRPPTTHHSSSHEKSRRYQPYDRLRVGRDTPGSPRQSKFSPSRHARDQKRKREWMEKKKREKIMQGKNHDDINIDELEEVDCCDDNDVLSDVASSFSSDTPSSTSQRLDDGFVDDDLWATHISRTDTSVVTLDDEDDVEFPSLCEDIDVEVLKKAAQKNAETETEERKRDEEKREKSPLSSKKNQNNEPTVDIETTSSTAKHERNTKDIEREKRRERCQDSRSRRSQFEMERRRTTSAHKEDQTSKTASTTISRRHHETHPHAAVVESYAAGLGKAKERKETRRNKDERDGGGILPPTRSQIRSLLNQIDAREEEIHRRNNSERRPTSYKPSFYDTRSKIRVRKQPVRRSFL